MKSLPLILWAILIAASIGWYAFLVVHIGRKAGGEIRELIKTLSQRPPSDPPTS
jgi:hypothetical protein